MAERRDIQRFENVGTVWLAWEHPSPDATAEDDGWELVAVRIGNTVIGLREGAWEVLDSILRPGYVLPEGTQMVEGEVQ